MILERKYGIVLGRFQPFHIAHEAMVHEVIADGLTPVIAIGSSNVINDRNPYTFNQRKEMIKLVFSNNIILPVNDYDNWDNWFKEFVDSLPTALMRRAMLDKANIVWYINNKEIDRTYFEFNGRLYNNTFYTQIFKDLGYEVKHVTYPSLLGLNINATDIRKNLEAHRHFLDARVYTYLKDIESGKEKVSYYK